MERRVSRRAFVVDGVSVLMRESVGLVGWMPRRCFAVVVVASISPSSRIIMSWLCVVVVFVRFRLCVELSCFSECRRPRGL